MNAHATNLVTTDGLRIYDLDPMSAELWAIAGPDNLDLSAIDADSLPEGCRWVSDREWSEAEGVASSIHVWSNDHIVVWCQHCETVVEPEGEAKGFGPQCPDCGGAL